MKAAPPHFPYHHRTLAGHTDAEMLDRYEYCQRRFNAGLPNWRDVDRRILRLQKPVEIIHIGTVDISPCGATNGAESVMENANREGACNTAPGSDRKPVTEARS